MPLKTFLRTGSESFPYQKTISLVPLLFISLFCFTHAVYSYDRIVSLKPNLTEILFALGVGPKIVGVTTYCDYPPEAKKIDKVSDYLQPDLEKLVFKQPDLIVTSQENSSRREIEYLIRKGYKVLTFQTDTLDQLRSTILSLGKELGKSEEAQKIVSNFDAQLFDLQKKISEIKKQNPSWKPAKALFIVGQHPLIVAGSGNLINDITPYLGLENAVRGSRLKYPNFSVEQVYALAPELMINFAMGTESSEKAQQEAREELEKFKRIPAIQNKQLYFWDMGAIRAGPRLPQELHKLFEVIHSDSPKGNL